MNEKFKKILNCKGKFPQRVFLAIMLVLGVVNLFTMRICLSVAIVKMVKLPNRTSSYFVQDFQNVPTLQNDHIDDDLLSSLVLDITRNYAGTVMAASNGLGAVAGVLVPIVVGALTPHGTYSEWTIAFFITLAVLVISGVFYFFTAKADIQKWDLQDDETGEASAEPATETKK